MIVVDWAVRPATAALPLTDSQREILERLATARAAPHREVTRARAVLLAGDGVATTAIAQAVGASPASVTAWRERFAAEGLKGFGQVREGRGRKPSISAEKAAAIVHATLHDKPPGVTHWSCRTMARAQGVSPATVQRIWSPRGLQPHLVKTFKLSNDKRFEEKLTDVVGLYLDPRPGCRAVHGREVPDPGLSGGRSRRPPRRTRDRYELVPALSRTKYPGSVRNGPASANRWRWTS